MNTRRKHIEKIYKSAKNRQEVGSYQELMSMNISNESIFIDTPIGKKKKFG